MAKPNYSYEKRQRELAKKKKKEEKAARKAQGKVEGAPGTGDAALYADADADADTDAEAAEQDTAQDADAAVPAPPGRYVVRVRGVNACGPGAPSAERLVVVP